MHPWTICAPWAPSVLVGHPCSSLQGPGSAHSPAPARPGSVPGLLSASGLSAPLLAAAHGSVGQEDRYIKLSLKARTRPGTEAFSRPPASANGEGASAFAGEARCGGSSWRLVWSQRPHLDYGDVLQTRSEGSLGAISVDQMKQPTRAGHCGALATGACYGSRLTRRMYAGPGHRPARPALVPSAGPGSPPALHSACT